MIKDELLEPLLVKEKPWQGECSRMGAVIRDLERWDPYSHQVFLGHEGAVWSTLSTVDSRYFFSGSEDKSIIIWDANTGGVFGKLLGHTNTVNALELTEDDDRLISGAWDNTIRIWDWRNLMQTGALNGHTAGVYCFAMSKDRKTLLSGSGDYKVRIWDLENIAEVAVLDCSASSVFGLALGKDGKNILAGGWDGVIRIWNFENKALVSQTPCNAGVIQSLVVTSDSKFIIIGTRSNLVKVLNYEDRSQYFSFEMHNNWVRNLVTTVDGNYFITCSADKTMRIVNLREKVEEFNLEGHEGYVFGLSLSRDGKFLLSGASDKTMRKWEIGTASRSACLRGHTKCIMSVAVSLDGSLLVSGAEDRTVRLWSTADKKEIAVLNGHTDTVWGVAITDNLKYIVSVSGDKTLRIWDFTSKVQLASLTSHENPIFCVTTSHDSKLAVSGAQDKLVIVWSITDKKFLARLEGHTDTVFTVKVTHENKFIVSGAADYTIRVWSIEKLQLHRKIETKSGMIESVSLNSDDSLLVLGDRSNSVHLWDWKEKVSLEKFTAHSKWVKSVTFANDGNLFASCSNDFSIRVWNAMERRQEFIVLGHINTIRSVCFTRDNKCLISGSEDLTVRIWDLQDIRNLELADISGPIDSFVYLSNIKQEKLLKTSSVNSVLSSLRVNLAHIYAYMGNSNFLTKALELGCAIIIDTEGHSPLYYALVRNSQPCIDALLSFMIELKTTSLSKFLNYANALRSDLLMLLQNSSCYLPEFLDTIFYKNDSVKLPRFGVPAQTLPMYDLSHCANIDTRVFFKAVEEEITEIPVVFKTLPIQICMRSGSEGSLSLLKSIIVCTNPHILRTSLVHMIIELKWTNVFNFMLCIALLYTINVVLMVVQILSDKKRFGVYGAFFIANLMILAFECYKAYSLRAILYLNSWTIVSLTRTILCLMWVSLNLFGKETIENYYLVWFMVLFNFIHGTSYLKVFSTTRFYGKLVTQTILDSLPFILIFFFSTFAVGLLHYCAKLPEDGIFYIIWQSPYELNLESFRSNDVMPLEYAYFVTAAVLNVIVMLNLLIAVLGDAFDRLKSEMIEIENMEIIEMIYEVENFMLWRRKDNEKVFVHACHDPRAEHIEDLWEGKIKTITNLIQKCQEENRSSFKNIKEKLKDIELVKKQCSFIEEKLEKMPVK